MITDENLQSVIWLNIHLLVQQMESNLPEHVSLLAICLLQASCLTFVSLGRCTLEAKKMKERTIQEHLHS